MVVIMVVVMVVVLVLIVVVGVVRIGVGKWSQVQQQRSAFPTLTIDENNYH